MARGDKSVPAFKDRLLRAFDAWSGRHPERPARLARGEPAVLRIIAPLAVLVVIAALACAGFGYVLARQADDDLDAERRQALTGAVEVLQATIPGLGRIEPGLIPVLERLTGLKRLKLVTPAPSAKLSGRHPLALCTRTLTGPSSASARSNSTAGTRGVGEVGLDVDGAPPELASIRATTSSPLRRRSST